MRYFCDWCGKDFESNDDGIIKMSEHAPIRYSADDEYYSFCSYKCLRSWLAL
jgi:hypothetical protein